jgi:tetratricopeptide (TPR) repeat protein
MYKALIILMTLITMTTTGFVTSHIASHWTRPKRWKPLSSSSKAVKEHEEPLSLMFQRAVALQRSGATDECLKEYETFIKAATQCDVSPIMYAEVLANMGAVWMKRGDAAKAQEHFHMALQHRQLGTAHVNLALLALQQGSKTMDSSKGMDALQKAKTHCQQALQLKDDLQSRMTAERLLRDIDRMLEQMK